MESKKNLKRRVLWGAAGGRISNIEQGTMNYEVEIAAHRFAMLAMTERVGSCSV